VNDLDFFECDKPHVLHRVERGQEGPHLLLAIDDLEEVPSLPDTDMIDEIAEAKAHQNGLVRVEVKRAHTIAARHNVPIRCHVFTGHVVRTVVDFANDNGFDLVVIGATGNAALYERMLGTRADRIANLARCPVLIVR
jgi:nucleotide-binding universal stress UspA family protein